MIDDFCAFLMFVGVVSMFSIEIGFVDGFISGL